MLKGSFVALVTPFKNNKIDYKSLDNLIDFHLKNQTDGLLLCGTTAEAPAYSNDERSKLIKHCIEKIDGKIPVMVGTGTNNFDKTLKMTLHAESLGADYALVITPYYNKPTQKGMFRYFSKIAKNTQIPIVIYNVPGRTGINMTSETTIKLATNHKNIVGIKEASGNIVQASEIIRETREDFSVMSGEDAINYPLLACGAKGVISVTANILPKEVHELVDYTLKNQHKKAKNLHLKLLEINQKMFIETNPIPVKEALHMMNFLENEFRLPLADLETSNREILKNVLKKYNLIQ